MKPTVYFICSFSHYYFLRNENFQREGIIGPTLLSCHFMFIHLCKGPSKIVNISSCLPLADKVRTHPPTPNCLPFYKYWCFKLLNDCITIVDVL